MFVHFRYGPLTLLLLSPWLALGEPLEPRPFRAEYTGEFQGLPVMARAVRELSRQEDGSYLFTSSADGLLMEVAETTRFKIRDGKVVPLEYRYQRKVFGRNKQGGIRFDWGKKLAFHSETSSAIDTGTQDKLSYQVQLRMDVALALEQNQRQPLEYTIADNAERRLYRFIFIGEETLATPAGDIHTVVLQPEREDREKQTTLWLAPEHELLLVRLRQKEPDRGFELNLVAFELQPHAE